MTATEALRALGVRPQTLYANVSRRRIRAKADPQDSRRSLYHEDDVRRLARKRAGARKAEEVAAAAIEWGDPVLASAVSTVAGGRLWYRGEDAALLADSRTLEQIAALLWGLEAPAASGERAQTASRQAQSRSMFRDSGPTLSRKAGRARSHAAARASAKLAAARPAGELSSAFLTLARRASQDPPAHGRTLPVLRSEAADVLAALADAMLGAGHAAALHQRLASAWGRTEASDALRRALVLLADHELNASTFAARVTASTGASLAAAVLAGLATLTGPLHGRAAAGVRDLMEAAGSQGADAAVRDRLAQGQPIPGFGHPLYPEGDPRAASLLRQLRVPPELGRLRDVVEDLVGERPNIDFALAVLTRVHCLPRDAPLIVFSLARSVGWLAHALEQVTTGRLIRPRARYVGPPPQV